MPVVDVAFPALPQLTGTSVFPANHQRYMFSRFRHIDEILGDAVHALELRDETRLFPSVIRDATPAQRKILQDYVAQLRFALERFVEAQDFQDITRTVSGLWSLRTAVIFSQTAVTELRPMYLSGYGPLDPDAVQASERLVAELTTLLKRIGDYLDKGEQGDLAARLAQLDATADEITLLRELERIITAHGLVELRATLESLTERVAAPLYEVAVFGRVNSGKSSLLNWWLGQALLPTGVTPVTAVPTRIVNSSKFNGRVKIAGAPWREIPVAELAGYVSELANPGNRKRVLEIVLEVPGRRLSEGVCLMDTPGLGSLASVGAAQTLDYLPRCDLGIQLIEAGGVIAREDFSIARALLDGGSDLLIVLSKADRLTPAELDESVNYASELFSRELGVLASVRPVSTLPAQSSLAEEWFNHELLPRLLNHRDQAARLLRRKVGTLLETVAAVLASRLDSSPKVPGTKPEEQHEPLHERLARLRAQLEQTRSDFLARTGRVHDCSEWLVDGAKETLLGGWLDKDAPFGDLQQRLQETIAKRAAEIGDVVLEGLKEGREQLQRDLTQMFPAETPELPRPRGRPPYDTDVLPPLTSYQRPRWAFARPLLLFSAKQRIESALLPALTERLSLYGEALKLWGTRYLHALSQRIDELAALAEAKERSHARAPASPEAISELRRDLALLQSWPSRALDAPVSTLEQVQRSKTEEGHDH